MIVILAFLSAAVDNVWGTIKKLVSPLVISIAFIPLVLVKLVLLRVIVYVFSLSALPHPQLGVGVPVYFNVFVLYILFKVTLFIFTVVVLFRVSCI